MLFRSRKVQKRSDAAGLREKLESLNLEITMPAGANGKLYGAVTSQTVMDELAKQGYQIERKRVELPGNTFKNVGKYKVVVKLYESAAAEITVNVLGQEIKTETRAAPASRPGRRRRDSPEFRRESAEQTPPEVRAEEAEASPQASTDAPAEETEAAPHTESAAVSST